jgi:hypothetical protein
LLSNSIAGRKNSEKSFRNSSNFSPGRTTTLAAMGPASKKQKRGNNPGVVARYPGGEPPIKPNRRLSNGIGRLFFED